MQRTQYEFSISEAGCLIYAGDKNLDGIPWSEMHASDWKALALRNALMMLSLYQDDGYTVRVVLGELTDEEKSEWTARATSKLNLESGEMVVSGVCDEDLEEYMEDFGDGVNVTDCQLGCIVAIPAREYRVDIYSYPPGDLSGGWMRIEDGEDFRLCFGEESGIEQEATLEYFQRTRPGEIAPKWIADGWEDEWFLNFLVHLSPATSEIPLPAFESDGCLEWEYRKPEICPIGIRVSGQYTS
jgi:hypothetical protein